MTEQSAQWWYESEGQQAGPISAGMLHDLIRSGQVRPTARVWCAGMAGWERIANVPELAAHAAAVPPPIAPPALEDGPGAPPAGPSGGGARQVTAPEPSADGWHAPQVAHPAPASGPVATEEISIAGVVVLSIVTLGIYGYVKFYGTGTAYERLAGRESRFATYFWLHVGLTVAAAFVWFAALGGIVFGVLTLVEALKLRDEGVRRRGLTVELTKESTHEALYVAGLLLSVFVVGVVLLVVQAVKWFEDWNRIVRALGPRRA